VTVSLSEAGFFGSGAAAVVPGAAAKLREVALALRAVGRPIAVEGHTDDVPISTAQYPSNWELSTARATTIVRYLVEEMSFDPRTLAATGFAEFRPLGDNATPEGRAANRRVDLVLLTEGAGGPTPR
jgi:chemotaxis protein MotB